MTASTLEKRTQSFDEAPDEPASSDFVSTRPNSRKIATQSLEVFPAESANIQLGLEHALRAARTPLIAGVDYQSPESSGDTRLPEPTPPVSDALEKSRVDTLSPLESVPPPAPFPAEPPPPRPSVVPPVRRPYGEQPSPRARCEPYANGIRSDPPPHVPSSDRPSRRAYSSNPPPRVSQSEPPPQSSHRGPNSQRRSWGDVDRGPIEAFADSPDSRRREAATIPADARLTAQALAYNPSMRLPALRTPSFPDSHLPMAVRRHENSRLRHVAMAMMFVIFIVTGAIAGMRWYVAREDASPSTPIVAETAGPRAPKVKLDRLEPNALVAPRRAPTAADTRDSAVAAPPKPALSERGTIDTTTDRAAPDTEQASSAIASPPTKPAKPRHLRASRSGVLDPSKIDTKTPLIND